MAYTKIHAITATVHKAVDYICNPDKTDEGILISSYGCSPETAAYDFKFALSKTKQSDPNKAYHLIQSFLPGEVSYKEAHQIGVELADKLLEGKYSYVVSTHIDKGHVHNHIIFCAADNINHEKYHDCKKTYYNIRSLSDNLCREHELSIITPGEKRGKTYKEWQAGKNGSAWKEQLKADIDEAIKNAATYEDCIELIRAKGYEVKGSGFEENAHKFISFRPLDKERFIRGSAKSLGAEYTKERIKKRIEEKALTKDKKHVPFPTRKKPIVKDYSRKNLIDTTEDKFAQSPGLKHWADIQNLKIAAASYSQAGSIAELEKQVATKSALAKTARESLVETERQLKDLGQILKYAEQYKANHIYHVRYKKSKDKDAYLRCHETELILHDGAENMLKRFGIDTKNLDVEKLRSDYNTLYSKKQTLQKTYKSAEREAADLNRKLDNLNQYLDRNPEQQVTDKKIDKNTQYL
ncbi:relaxase/mobilization nuclease domain-containing protein [Roseburia sp. 1XD42-69]|uniref:relaxase/mobilization nuclease domain-containing protein n=1 Tax=Roseburia sp. 1XD42-69 TaxID=2320088 RepID=UPI000EA028FF|nr:relaxase/mobilization nuclease domain-containing protein [Roseburia sp. 1XD42-69]RKJ63628.1 rlx protein [Roseburia sp. 1XD42-69]